jgi:integrase
MDRASPFTRELLLKAFSNFDLSNLRDVRDKALLCVGFAGALRRSEIVGIQVADLKFKNTEGMMLRIPVSKTDQERAGQFVAIPYATNRDLCPVAATEAWLGMSGITRGALFRGVRKNGAVRETVLNAGSVNEIVKRAALRAGLRPADVEDFSGHSLRSGFVTTAREAGVPDHLIMATTRHRDPRSLNGYDRPENLLENTAWGWAGW